MVSHGKNNIDFVIMWVDDTDAEWRAEKERYVEVEQNVDSSSSDDYRYRDWNLLKYWFRSIEKFCPWVNRVFFVTYGHYPEWLNLNNPKLRLVKHSDFIPAEFLPTFSSHTIELNLHRIPDLSEQFVLFNDDTFVVRPLLPNDFFVQGKIVDVVGLNAITPHGFNTFYRTLYNDVSLINRHFSPDVIRGCKRIWLNPLNGVNVLRTFIFSRFPDFTGFHVTHAPQPHLKSTFREVWEVEKECLHMTCSNKFRSGYDVNQYVFKWWNWCSGRVNPCSSRGRYANYYIEGDNAEQIAFDAARSISRQSSPFVLVNDGHIKETLVLAIHRMISDAFMKVVPNKSTFEN